ncbi:hypothetical protein [Dysgonomonas sp. 25]|uniref:hypothetical protein n=1 Tax=Dysgonomonas sp. 25 TaxID=2302933 RepID=UPI0013D20AA5|nr:hypothetical protein [Dysgonomonas sp. 25]NDV69267.1 hypothetical protein [Dysgonomonas sp. 25]
MSKYILLLSLLLLAGCRAKTVYIPVETVRTEYKDRLMHDSVHHYDSIFVREKGDTLWLEKYRYLYRDRIISDSIHINDTIRVPYPVIETREVNRLSSFQSFQVWCGRILLLLLALWLGAKWMRR